MKIGLSCILIIWLITAVSGQARDRSISLFFTLQSSELHHNAVKLNEFIKKEYKPGEIIIVRGSACDIGGKETSLRIAELRADHVIEEIKKLYPGTDILRAPGVVIEGIDRPSYRKTDVYIFSSKQEADRFLKGEKFVEPSHQADAINDKNYNFYLLLILFLILLLLLFLLWLYLSRKKKRRHQITEEMSAELALLTQASSVSHDAEAEPVLHRPILPANVIQTGKKNMAVKKQIKQTPITIRGAVDKQFEDKTLGQLAKSPVHALEGLTPRHARLLEEAFGIKCIEDLAKLKYFEIAKAIVILSKYEK